MTLEPPSISHVSEEETMYTLTISDQMLVVIAAALGNHPYRESAPVILEIQKQISNQRVPSPPTNGKDSQEEQRIGNV